MPIPTNAIRFVEPMDPNETLDFETDISQGDADTDLLRSGEGIESFHLELTAESMFAGLVLLADGAYAPTLDGLTLKFWIIVDQNAHSAAIFNDPGAEFGIEATFTTDNIPPRVRQRTVVARLMQL